MTDTRNIAGREIISNRYVVKQEDTNLITLGQFTCQSTDQEGTFILLKRNAKHIINGRNIGRSAHIIGDKLQVLIFRRILYTKIR